MMLSVHSIKEVRLMLDNPAKEGEPDYITVIRQFRQQTARLVHGTALAPAVFEKFAELWDYLNKDPTGEYYLPPLYISDDIDKLLRVIVGQLLQRERRLLRSDSDNTGHAVLGGVEGTGKTTILRAIVYAVTFLFHRMLPVCFQFSEIRCPLPSALIRAACEDLKIPLPDEKGELDDLSRLLGAFEEHHSVLLVLDEFQQAFALTDSPAVALGQRLYATGEVAAISRYGNSYGLIAGSSADMRGLMFRSGPRENPDAWRALGYPDFNGSLYLLHTIPALRDTRSLNDFVARRYPNWTVSSTDVAELLYYTGGVGRFLNEAFRATGAPSDHAPVEGVSSAVTYLRQRLVADGRRSSPAQSFFDNANLRIIATCITEAYASTINSDRALERHQLCCIGVPMQQLAIALRAFDADCNPADVIHSLVDQSLLYNNGTSQVELTRPADAHVYTDQQEHGMGELQLYMAVQFMLRGIATQGERTTHVNAGTPLEKLARRHIHTTLLDAGVKATWSPITIRTTAGGFIEVNLPNTEQWRRLDAELLTLLDSCLVAWANETGLDGLVFQRSTDTLWQLHGWQCKGGHITVEITGGKMTTSIDAYVKDGVVADLDDSTSHGIIVKAQVGFLQLIAAWHRTLGDGAASLLPASLLITTTKNATKARASIEKDFTGGMRFSDRVAAVALRSSPVWLTAVLSARCRITLNDGVGWLQRCLPSSLTDLLPLRDVSMPASAEPASRCIIM